ncbi:MAG: glycosyltransferase, partial [Elusimicrobiota bacterium]
TILKPIKGIDRGMVENLASFLSQDHPRFQVIFCLHDPEDPALPLLRALKAEHPEADAEIVISGHRIGYNPKVNNLSNATPYIKHDLLMLSDSDVRVEVDFLRRATRDLEDPSVGLATYFYVSRNAGGAGSALEALSVNAQFLPQALTAAVLGGMRFAMGAAILVRRSVFDAAGGFPALSAHLADDFRLGEAVASLGSRVEIARPVVTTVPEDLGWTEHFDHMVRQMSTIRVCSPAGYLGSALLQGFFLLCLHALLFGPTALTLSLLLLTAACRMGSTAWIHAAVLRDPGMLRLLPLLPVSDLLQTAAWVAGLRTRTVSWRGETYSVEPSGRLLPSLPRLRPRVL